MKSKKKNQVAKSKTRKECENTPGETKLIPKIRRKEDENGQEIYELDFPEREKMKSDKFGTDDKDLGVQIINQVCGSISGNEQSKTRAMNASLAMFYGIEPKDEIEAALAVQMVGIHNATVEMTGRAMHPEQTTEGVSENINRAVKLSRTYMAQMEALRKHRNKGQQTIQVQHVTVEEGGQAIVGNVKTGGVGEK